MTAMDRTARLAPLGRQRLRILDCLGGNNRWAPGYFEPDADTDIRIEFGRYVARMCAEWAGDADRMVHSLLAAARVLTGDLAAALVIVDGLPRAPIALDHGAGICVTAPMHALSAAVPLPSWLAETSRWLAGSPEQDALRAWLTEHSGHLRWVDADGVYSWAAPSTPPASRPASGR